MSLIHIDRKTELTDWMPVNLFTNLTEIIHNLLGSLSDWSVESTNEIMAIVLVMFASAVCQLEVSDVDGDCLVTMCWMASVPWLLVRIIFCRYLYGYCTSSVA